MTTEEMLNTGFYHKSVSSLYEADQVEAALKRLQLDPVLHRLSFGFKRRGELLAMGDLPLQLVLRSGLLGEEITNKPYTPHAAYCIVRRKGLEGSTMAKYTVAQAKKHTHAKGSFYHNYPEQFLKFSARSLALKERFCDVLCGFALNEGELRDEIIPTEPGAEIAKELGLNNLH